MHSIEPFYNWRHLYTVEEDDQLPFYGKEYSEFEFSETIYNYYIHPQWDNFGSSTLFVKILFVDYKKHFCMIEFIGEWNDALHNDIMVLKRELLEILMLADIQYFIFIGENIFNFHGGEKDYYKEWQEELIDQKGWATIVNLHPISQHDFRKYHIQKYIPLIECEHWRTFSPLHFFLFCKKIIP